MKTTKKCIKLYKRLVGDLARKTDQYNLGSTTKITEKTLPNPKQHKGNEKQPKGVKKIIKNIRKNFLLVESYF